jgi:hypothetical protein
MTCMKSLRSATAHAIVALSWGLVHCSSGPAQPEGMEPNGGATVGGATAGSVAGGAGPVAGNAPSGSGGSAGQGGGGGASGSGASAGGGGIQAQAGAGGAGGSSAGMGGTGGAAGNTNGSCSNDAIVCEDFEQYPAAAAPAGGWTPSLRGDGKIVVDRARAFSGQQSLHVTGRMNADRANISRPIQTSSATAYVRFMFYATSYPASAGVHTRLMRIGTAQAATGNPDSSYSLSSYNGTAIEKVNSIYLRDTGTKLNDPKLLNRWTCWEFGIDRTGGVGNVKVQLWVDGRELTLSPAGSSSHGMTSPSWDPIPFDLFMLGLDGFQADTQAADFWIDDLSVTPQRVGCKVAQ